MWTKLKKRNLTPMSQKNRLKKWGEVPEALW